MSRGLGADARGAACEEDDFAVEGLLGGVDAAAGPDFEEAEDDDGEDGVEDRAEVVLDGRGEAVSEEA